MIIDVHYHVGKNALGPYDYAIDQRWVEDEMRMFDVQKTIVFPYRSAGSYEALNREIIDTFANESILPFGRVRLNFRPTDSLTYLSKIKIRGPLKRGSRMIKEVIARRGIKPYVDEVQEKELFKETMRNCWGIKYHDNQDGQLHEQHFEFLLSFGKPIIFHINPCKLEYFLANFGSSVRAPIVIAHLGAIDADSVYLRRTRALLARYDFLYTDTAAHVFSNHLIPFLRETPDKILFGSDGPVVSQGSTRCLFLQAGREYFGDGEKSLELIKDNTRSFCAKAGWTT